MTIETSLCHPVLRDFLDGLGMVPKKDPEAEPKTAFQKWCRGIQPKAQRAAHRPKTRSDFIPRAQRRRAMIGAGPHWRTVWRATGGYPDLIDDLKKRIAAQRAAS